MESKRGCKEVANPIIDHVGGQIEYTKLPGGEGPAEKEAMALEVDCLEHLIQGETYADMEDWELAFVRLLKEIGMVNLPGLLERREWLAVWAMLAEACSKGGGGCASRL